MASINYYNNYSFIDLNIKKYLDKFIIKTLIEISEYKFKNLNNFFYNFEVEIAEKICEILQKEIKVNQIIFDEELFENIEKYIFTYSTNHKLRIANIINYLVSEILENKPSSFLEFYESIKKDKGLNSLNIV